MKEDSGLSSASKQLQQCTCGGGGGGGVREGRTPVDKGLSLHIPTLSPAHQHMHNMHADLLALKVMLCLRSLLSTSPAHTVATVSSDRRRAL